MNNNTQSNKLEDAVFWYKAEMHPDFKLGSPKFWQMSHEIYQEQSGMRGNQYDPDAATRRKGPSIQVRKTS